ncbi:hypothetical protein H632_c690p2 [Helicosporidium sp. ATCC 50920]|nr:hypothetical protein H632_c690p2 [Helicosporidium sp. ATCC 50920]|eukprot:KDD75427.1 hypothetical protein H632_c690p2 [Helicosporidium sp. ATCC 50920]
MNATQKYVAVNLRQLARFEPHERVTIEKLKHVGVLHATGSERSLPLKILGTGEILHPLTVEAASVSAAARFKIEAAGGTIIELPAKVKWTRAAHELRQKDMLKALERLAGTDADETSDDGE